MASDTVPAAVPGPGDPPSTPPAATPAPGGMAGLLAPVAPVRFSLDPTDGTAGHTVTDTAAGGEQAVVGASSADFHNADTTPGPGAQNSATRTDQTGIIRAWLLAGAERWRKGADARNKALDIKKARAQAYKESVTTTVNRSEKTVGGSTSTNSGTNTQSKADKNTGTRTSTHNGGSGAGRGSGAGGSGSGGSSRHNGSGSGSGGGNGRGNGSGHGGGRQHGAGPGSGGSGRGGSGGGSGSDGRHKPDRTNGKGSDRGPGRDRSGTTHNAPSSRGNRDTSTTGGTGRDGRTNGPGRADTNTTAPGPRGRDRAAREPGRDVTTQTCGDASGINPKKPAKQERTDKPTAQKTPETYKVVLDKDPKPAPTDLKNTPKDGTPTTGSGKDTKTQPATGTQNAPGAPGRINTQGAREAGYRDGTRVGQVIAQAGAYRDGAKDGLADTRQAAQQEKDRLDQARKNRRNGTGNGQPQPQLRPPLPEQSAKPGPDAKATADPTTPGTAIPPRPTHPPRPTEPPAPSPRDVKKPGPDQPSPTTTPTNRPAPAAPAPKDKTVPASTSNARPIQVLNVGPNAVVLGAGASRSHVGRGEVRTLKAFERRLQAKADTMVRIYEVAGQIKAHANEQLKQVIWWTEQAKVIEGGDALIGALKRLEQEATTQVAKAEEIRKRAARAAESCQTLLANVKTRYGQIYQAVVNASLDQPAVMSYYKESASA